MGKSSRLSDKCTKKVMKYRVVPDWSKQVSGYAPDNLFNPRHMSAGLN